MIRAKNYEAVSKLLKDMPRILWPLFFRTRCMYVRYGEIVDCITDAKQANLEVTGLS